MIIGGGMAFTFVKVLHNMEVSCSFELLTLERSEKMDCREEYHGS